MNSNQIKWLNIGLGAIIAFFNLWAGASFALGQALALWFARQDREEELNGEHL